MPGMMISSTSRRIDSKGSPSWGGAGGSLARTSPGARRDSTGYLSTFSRYSDTQSPTMWPERRKSSGVMAHSLWRRGHHISTGEKVGKKGGKYIDKLRYIAYHRPMTTEAKPIDLPSCCGVEAEPLIEAATAPDGRLVTAAALSKGL